MSVTANVRWMRWKMSIEFVVNAARRLASTTSSWGVEMDFIFGRSKKSGPKPPTRYIRAFVEVPDATNSLSEPEVIDAARAMVVEQLIGALDYLQYSRPLVRKLPPTR